MHNETVALILGLAAWALNMAGNILIMYKRASGWLVRIVSIVLWGLYGISDTSLPNILNSVTFFAFNLYAWRQWRLEEKEKAVEVQEDVREEMALCDECHSPVLMMVGTDVIQCRCSNWTVVAVETQDNDEGPGAA